MTSGLFKQFCCGSKGHSPWARWAGVNKAHPWGAAMAGQSLGQQQALGQQGLAHPATGWAATSHRSWQGFKRVPLHTHFWQCVFLLENYKDLGAPAPQSEGRWTQNTLLHNSGSCRFISVAGWQMRGIHTSLPTPLEDVSYRMRTDALNYWEPSSLHMKMVWWHVKYTVLRGQLETYFVLMDLVLFYFTF